MNMMQVSMEKLQRLETGKRKIETAYSQGTPVWIFGKD